MNISFDNGSKKFILDAFDKSTDDENYVVEKSNPSQRVLTSGAEEVRLGQFAGLLKGSEIFIKSDIDSLIDASDHIQ